MSVAVSKALSIMIIGGSLTLQAPQIYKIVSSKSAAGLSALGWAVSIASLTLSIIYNVRMEHPFTTWGENIFVVAQLVILTLLKRYYDGASFSGSVVRLVALACLVLGCFWERTPTQLLVTLPVPLSCLSSVPQLLENSKNGHTGQLALLPVIFTVIGLTIRVFTTMTEIDDKLALIAVIVPCCLNLLLLFQVLLLPGGGVAEKKKKKK